MIDPLLWGWGYGDPSMWGWTDEVTTAFKGPLVFIFTGIACPQILNIQVRWP